MKVYLIFTIAILSGITLSAQTDGIIPLDKAKVTNKTTLLPIVLDPSGPATIEFRQGDVPRTPGVDESQVGLSMYDLQSNATTQNRLYVYPDNSIGAVWTLGSGIPSFNDRGTGYNYFNGVTWGAFPTARITSETVKNGWPSYAPLGAGEMIISHTSVAPLYFTKRAIKGTGAWSTTNIPGTNGYAWPRAITSNGKIHLIVNTNAQYQGLSNAIVYLSSSDNGATWTAPTILPGMTASSFTLTTGFTGFGGDTYTWATPHGDTIAFAFGNLLGGLWIMKSINNGLTWTRTTVYQFPHFTGSDSPIATTFDETFAIALDNQAKVHLVTTRYKIVNYNSTANPVSWNYYPYTDGIVYWNENMPQIDTSVYNNVDILINLGMYVGGMLDYNNNGQIDFPEVGSEEKPWGGYRYVGPSGMPQIIVDNNNNKFVSYSSCREDLINIGANPNVQLYKHIYLSSQMNNQSGWTDPIDLNDDILHSYDEVVWGNMAIGGDGKLHFLCQMDPEPGTALGSDLDSYGDNFITYFSYNPGLNSFNISVSANPVNGGNVTGGGSYNSGSQATVVATALSGWSFINWTENGSQVSANPSYSFTVNSNRNLVANFTQGITFSIVTSSNPTLGGSTSGGGTYTNGSLVTVIATPNSGYAFINWTENGNAVSTSPSYSFIVSANRNLVANFSQQATQYTITAAANPINAGFTTGGGTYNAGSQATVLATANSGWTFVNWTEYGSQVSSNPSYTFTVTSNRSLVANFTQGIIYTISTSSNPVAGGSTSGGGTYASGTQVTVIASPNNGYDFINWTENGNVVSTNSAYGFTVTGNRTLVANFGQQGVQYLITASANPANGGYTAGGGSYNAGTQVLLIATANSGWAFVNWTEFGSQVSSSPTYTFTANANRDLVANFVLQFIINAVASPSNAGYTTGGGTYTAGQTANVQATANPGWAFYRWSENGNTVSTSASYSFIATSNRSLTAAFLSTVGITENEKDVILIYPNPTNNLLFIEMKQEYACSLGKIELFNTNGKCVYISNGISATGKLCIDVHTYPNGSYLLKLSISDGQEKSYKIVIQK
jgi:hypothetical protein